MTSARRLKDDRFPDLKNALRAERTFYRGQTVRFTPPEGAYSQKSLQALAAGQTGIVDKIYNDSYLLAAIAGWNGVVLNTAYLEAQND